MKKVLLAAAGVFGARRACVRAVRLLRSAGAADGAARHGWPRRAGALCVAWDLDPVGPPLPHGHVYIQRASRLLRQADAACVVDARRGQVMSVRGRGNAGRDSRPLRRIWPVWRVLCARATRAALPMMTTLPRLRSTMAPRRCRAAARASAAAARYIRSQRRPKKPAVEIRRRYRRADADAGAAQAPGLRAGTPRGSVEPIAPAVPPGGTRRQQRRPPRAARPNPAQHAGSPRRRSIIAPMK